MKVVAFDVNETLLDLAALDPIFNGYFGSPLTRQEWFDETIKAVFVSTITGYYEPFPQLALSSLELLEKRYNKTLSEADRTHFSEATLHLPAHPDAAPALKRLAAAGCVTVALGNNIGSNIEAQLRRAGLWEYLRHIFGSETVQRMKPAKEPYQFVARSLGCAVDEITMVACHPWDIAGARAAGLDAAFIERPGQFLTAAIPSPKYVAPSLTAFAEAYCSAA